MDTINLESGTLLQIVVIKGIKLFPLAQRAIGDYAAKKRAVLDTTQHFLKREMI